MGLSVVLLAYKEEENLRIMLPRVIENIKKIPEPFEIIVVDSEKPLDNTKGVCEEFGVKYVNQEYPGYGGAFRTGIKHATMDKYLTLDSDGSHDPDKFLEIYEKFVKENCDVVIGSRYVKGGRTDDKKSSVIMSKILNFVFRIFLGIKAKDISTSYRMYSAGQLKAVELDGKNYDVLQEVLIRLKNNKKNLKVDEVPIYFSKRVFGDSKRKLIPFIIDYIKLLFKLMFIRQPVLKNIMLYGVFGLIAAGLEYCVFSLLIYLKVFPYAVISNIIASLCGFAFTFLTNTFLNFKKKNRLIFRLLSYGLICAGGMAFSSLMIHLLGSQMNLYVLKAILIVFVSLVQFILNKLITYRK